MQRFPWATRTLVLVTIVGGAWIGADITSEVIAARIAPTDASDSPPRAGIPGDAAVRSGYEVIAQRGIFGPQPEVGEGGGVGEIPVVLARCTLNVTLLSVVPVAGAAASSLATFRTTENTPLCIAVGEYVADGVQLVEVRRDGAVVKNGTEVCELALGTELPSRPALPSAGGRPVAADGSGIRKVGGGRYQVSEGQVRQILAGGMDIAKTVYVQPFIDGGVTKGFWLKRIKSGSPLTQLGLKSGDIVTTVNGLEINSPAAALQAYQRFQNDRHFEVDILRGGKPQTLRYDVL